MKNLNIYDILFALPLFYFVYRMLFHTSEMSRLEGFILVIPIVYLWFRDRKKEE